MNLFWLKYVSWALVGGAVFFYFTLRLNKLLFSRAVQIGLYTACIVLACVAWHVQERNADLYSPRQLVVGTVTSVSTHSNKSGSIRDSFYLRLESGATSQEFTTTDSVAESAAQQPLHPGDLLGVFYRTWDDVPLTIDEIEGQQPGWHYRRFPGDLSVFVWTVAGTGFFGLLGALIASSRMARKPPEPYTTLHLND